MKEISLEERLEQMKESTDPYERGMARGIEIAMMAYEPKNDPGADQSNRVGQKNITRSL